MARTDEEPNGRRRDPRQTLVENLFAGAGASPVLSEDPDNPLLRSPVMETDRARTGTVTVGGQTYPVEASYLSPDGVETVIIYIPGQGEVVLTGKVTRG